MSKLSHTSSSTLKSLSFSSSSSSPSPTPTPRQPPNSSSYNTEHLQHLAAIINDKDIVNIYTKDDGILRDYVKPKKTKRNRKRNNNNNNKNKKKSCERKKF